LFDESVRIRLRSDVPVGSSFSGGIDSSSVVASIITQNPGIRLNTFTARFDDADYDEGNFIKYMTDKFDFNTHFCYPNEDLLLDELEKVFYHQEEPFGSTSIVAQWAVMKLAKENGVTVLLDGQGADETLAGYYKYFTPFLMELYKSEKGAYLNQLNAINENLGENYALSKSQSLYTKMPSIHSKLSNFIRPLTLKKTVSDISEDFYRTNKKLPSPFKHFDNLDESLYFDTFKYGLGKLLRFADRNSMAFSREVRLPYLSHKLVEFVFSLPKEYKMNQGWSKYILRLAMEDVLPKEIGWRKDKKGFQAPDSWMKNGKIKDLIETGVEYLKKHDYITTPDKDNLWKYLTIYQMFNSAE
jgi:asparagine synthase (glutamine-hydrolysing)